MRIQCHECEGFGNIAAECANTVKKNNKSFVTSWSDSDSESSKAEEDVSFIALNVVSSIKSDDSTHKQMIEQDVDLWSSGDDIEVTDEEIVKNYHLLNEKWLVVIERNKMLNQNITGLKLEKNELEKKILELSTKNEQLVTTVENLKEQVKSKHKAFLELTNLRKM